jgi:hypothetical protein
MFDGFMFYLVGMGSGGVCVSFGLCVIGFFLTRAVFFVVAVAVVVDGAIACFWYSAFPIARSL